MLNRTEIAARIGDAQYRLANGEDSLAVERDLIALRKEVASGIGTDMATVEAEIEEGFREQILGGFRNDALAQLQRLRELLTEADLQTIPDMNLFHLSCCAELVRQKVILYFHQRNGITARSIIGGASCQG